MDRATKAAVKRVLATTGKEEESHLDMLSKEALAVVEEKKGDVGGGGGMGWSRLPQTSHACACGQGNADEQHHDWSREGIAMYLQEFVAGDQKEITTPVLAAKDMKVSAVVVSSSGVGSTC